MKPYKPYSNFYNRRTNARINDYIDSMRRSRVSEYIEKKHSTEQASRREIVNKNLMQENFDRTVGFFKKASLDSVGRSTILDRDQFSILQTIVSQTSSMRVAQIMAERKIGSNEYGNETYFDENIQARKVAECANNLTNMFASDFGFKKFVFTRDENSNPMLCYLNVALNEDSREEFTVEVIPGAKSLLSQGKDVPEELAEISPVIDSFAECIDSNVMV